ncbi:MAG: hypothetical protein KKI09_10875 [Spirochaetes bacterium]|nr:hypothetical protein [Spirochaetota bacterium]
MTVLVLHYHLKPGGVGTVIRRQMAVLRLRGIRSLVLLGEAPAADPGFPYQVEKALSYDAPAESGPTGGGGGAAADGRVSAIAEAIRRNCAGLDGRDTLIHAHNANIRKNSALLPAVRLLVQEGYRFLLQVHDVAEDWRPDVYPHQDYPEGCWWAALNRRDCRNFAVASGSPVFFLPNPVSDTVITVGGESAAVDRSANSLYLYPVRGIRRKNLGEALLLSSFLPEGRSVGVTLPPNNPKDRPVYETWQHAAGALNLPLHFELGLQASLDELYSRSRAVLSTSIKEGFGLSFLETAIRGCPLLGRSIPYVLEDFAEQGIVFPHLYHSIFVPDDQFDKAAFGQRLSAALRNAFAAYRLGPPVAAALEQAATSLTAGLVDFGRLDEIAQLEVLHSLRQHSGARSALQRLNPWLSQWWQAADTMTLPSENQLTFWSLEAYAERLLACFAAMETQTASAAPDRQKLLILYLNPDTVFGVGVQT